MFFKKFCIKGNISKTMLVNLLKVVAVILFLDKGFPKGGGGRGGGPTFGKNSQIISFFFL